MNEEEEHRLLLVTIRQALTESVILCTRYWTLTEVVECLRNLANCLEEELDESIAKELV